MEDREYYMKQAKQVLLEVKKTVIGKDEVICKVMMALLANGHILIEDIPGVGKTTMVMAFAKALGLKCNRIQFTPDVMPSDITGFNMYNKETGKFQYKSGAANCNILLGDEINRTSPKTQSALLQIMEERQITVDGATYQLPNPFIVMATQNPYGSIGTQKLPESQLDRFMIRLNMGYPTLEDEINILKSKEKKQEGILTENVVSVEDFLAMQQIVNGVHVDDSIYEYVARIVKETRNTTDILQGVSPRGSITIIAMAKAEAFLRGHEYVLPSDVQYVLEDTTAHRIVLNKGIRRTGAEDKDVLTRILERVPAPHINEKII